jgi:hypothetical protein
MVNIQVSSKRGQRFPFSDKKNQPIWEHVRENCDNSQTFVNLAKNIPNHKQKEIGEKYKSILSHEINHLPFSEEENFRLGELVLKLGTIFSKFTGKFYRRSSRQLQIQFSKLKRKSDQTLKNQLVCSLKTIISYSPVVYQETNPVQSCPKVNSNQ